MSDSNFPTGLRDEGDAIKNDAEELSADDKACLARILKMRQAGLQEPDDIAAVLKYFASCSMELSLEYYHALHLITKERTKPLLEIPELSPLVTMHLGVARQYQRDLDSSERFKHAKRKAELEAKSRPITYGFTPADKPR